MHDTLCVCVCAPQTQTQTLAPKIERIAISMPHFACKCFQACVLLRIGHDAFASSSRSLRHCSQTWHMGHDAFNAMRLHSLSTHHTGRCDKSVWSASSFSQSPVSCASGTMFDRLHLIVMSLWHKPGHPKGVGLSTAA